VQAHYLYYALTNRAAALPSLAGRAAVPIVNKSNFAKFAVALPCRTEQQEIARILSAVDIKIEAEKRRRGAAQDLFQSMLQQLMTGQIRA
jgi:type I restriction enzyme S subunit